MGAHQIGFIFFGWGVLLAITSVFVAPMIQRRFGTLAGIVGALLGFAVILAAMAIGTENKTVLVVGVILAGAFLGVNNTLITETVMKVAPVERGVASAAYSFVRFSGGAVAPWLAGNLGEKSIHLPFWVGPAPSCSPSSCSSRRAASSARSTRRPDTAPSRSRSRVEAEALTVGDA